MQDVELELSTAAIEPAAPDGIEIVPATPEHDRGAYAVALEADADIPAPETIVPGDFEAWRRGTSARSPRASCRSSRSSNGTVVGYARRSDGSPRTPTSTG